MHGGCSYCCRLLFYNIILDFKIAKMLEEKLKIPGLGTGMTETTETNKTVRVRMMDSNDKRPIIEGRGITKTFKEFTYLRNRA